MRVAHFRVQKKLIKTLSDIITIYRLMKNAGRSKRKVVLPRGGVMSPQKMITGDHQEQPKTSSASDIEQRPKIRMDPKIILAMMEQLEINLELEKTSGEIKKQKSWNIEYELALKRKFELMQVSKQDVMDAYATVSTFETLDTSNTICIATCMLFHHLANVTEEERKKTESEIAMCDTRTAIMEAEKRMAALQVLRAKINVINEQFAKDIKEYGNQDDN